MGVNTTGLLRLTPDEAREQGKRGGQASVKSRREKKAMRDALETILAMTIREGKSVDIDRIRAFPGLKSSNITVKDAVLIAQVQKALKGDTRAAEFVRDSIGERPDQNVNVAAEVAPIVIHDDVVNDDA